MLQDILLAKSFVLKKAGLVNPAFFNTVFQNCFVKTKFIYNFVTSILN